jgi:HlyD family secretion protein
MRTFVKVAVFVVLSATGLGAYFHYADAPKPPQVTEAAVTQGDVVESVTATGTLAPMRTVEIGSQVSGHVTHVYVDYNSIVKQGEVLARLDPSIIQDQLDSARATLDQSKIALDEREASLVVDQHNRERIEDLYQHGLDSQVDREAAQLQVREDQAQIEQDKTAIILANAQIEQAQVNLDHCTIISPIDGVVVERDVDEGQSVAAGVQAPKLFVLATNLKHLELLGSIDEADVSKLSPGEPVSFTVEDYPRVRFHGTVVSVRLNATETNSVVTYQAVIDAENPDLQLRPSMTAQITMEIWRESNVLRVPNSALKFRPPHQVFEAFGEAPPEAVKLNNAAGAVSPNVARVAPPASTVHSATGASVDKLFQTASPLETTGQVYVMDHGQLKRVTLTLGISDGTWTAVESGDLKPGQPVVTAVVLPNVKATTGPNAGNPLMTPQYGGGRGGPGPGR